MRCSTERKGGRISELEPPVAGMFDEQGHDTADLPIRWVIFGDFLLDVYTTRPEV